jgi:hypothetical protein
VRQVEIQQALYNRLSTDADIITYVADRIYDDVPQKTDYPYIVIGEGDSVDFDSDTFTGSEATLIIHTWSRYSGRLETKAIQTAIYNALHRYPLILTDGLVIDNFIEYADSALEPDGETRHGVQRLRIISMN